MYKIVIENSERLNRQKFRALVTKIRQVGYDFDLILSRDYEESRKERLNGGLCAEVCSERRTLLFISPDRSEKFNFRAFEAKLTRLNFTGEFGDEMEPRFEESALKRVQVEIIEPYRAPLLKCLECGRPWSPEMDFGGRHPRLPHDYWRCPNGCAAKKESGAGSEN